MVLLKELHAELAQLERELGQNILYQKLVRVRDIIAIYAAGTRDANAPQRTAKPSPREEASKRRKAAADACSVILQGRSVPTMAGELDRILIGKGLGLLGRDPVSSLSAALGKDDRFVVQGRKGWLLANQPGTLDASSASRGGDEEHEDDADQT